METHLSADLDFEQRFDLEHKVPVHLVLAERAGTYEDYSSVARVYFKTLGDDGQWERARFTFVPREVVLEDFICSSRVRLLGADRRDGGSATVSFGGGGGGACTRVRFAIFVSAAMSCRDGAIVPTDVLRVRLVMRPPSAVDDDEPLFPCGGGGLGGSLGVLGGLSIMRREGRVPRSGLPPYMSCEPVASDAAVGACKTVDFDFLQKDVITSRLRNLCAIGMCEESDVVEIPPAETSAAEKQDDVESVCSLETATAERQFFKIDPSRKLSAELSEFLRQYSGARDAGRVQGGALEEPSIVRGLPPPSRPTVRGAFPLDVSKNVEEQTPVIVCKSNAWLGPENRIAVAELPELRRQVRAYVVWYGKSFWAGMKVRQRVSDRMSLKTSLARSFTDLADFLSKMCENVCVGLERELSARQGLHQRFSCALEKDLDFGPILDVLCVSKHVWVNQANENSCIIKALTHRLCAEALGNRVRYCERGQPGGNDVGVAPVTDTACWADVIDCVRGKVYGGIDVQLCVCPRTGLLSVRRRDGRDAAWVCDPRLCVLYARRDLRAFWTVPGGFAAEFTISLDGLELGVLRERFKTP